MKMKFGNINASIIILNLALKELKQETLSKTLLIEKSIGISALIDMVMECISYNANEIDSFHYDNLTNDIETISDEFSDFLKEKNIYSTVIG